MYPGFTDYSAPTQANAPMNLGSPVHVDSPMSTTGNYNPTTVFTPSGNVTLNYSNNTNEHMRLLTGSERRDLELPRELFVNIRMLDVIEKAFSFEKIAETEYYSRTENILNKIDRFIQIVQQKNPNITLDIFIQEYGLNDCTWAIQRIKKNKSKDDHGQSVHALVANVTSGFIRIGDCFFMNPNAQVKDVLPMIQEQKQLLDRLKPHFSKPGNPFNLSDHFTPIIQKLSAMDLRDNLTPQHIEEIETVNSYAKDSFGLLLR